MKYVDWDELKNTQLKFERGAGFEIVLAAIEENQILDNTKHPNKLRYPKQRVLIIEIDDYAYLVPYVEDEIQIFLKTIIPSRRATKNI